MLERPYSTCSRYALPSCDTSRRNSLWNSRYFSLTDAAFSFWNPRGSRSPPTKKPWTIWLDGLSCKMNKSDLLVNLLSGSERPLSEEEYRAYLSGLPSLSGRSCSLFRLRNTIFSSIVILDSLVAIFPRRYAIKEASIIFDDLLVVKAFQANCRKEIRLERLKKKDLLAVLPVWKMEKPPQFICTFFREKRVQTSAKKDGETSAKNTIRQSLSGISAIV